MVPRKCYPFIQLLTLLLLISYSVMGKSVSTTSDLEPLQKHGLHKAEPRLHENMLQPQLVHTTAGTPEHLAKPFPSGFGLLFLNPTAFVLPPLATTKIFLQDMDRCESVSKLLFPYHIFL